MNSEECGKIFIDITKIFFYVINLKSSKNASIFQKTVNFVYCKKPVQFTVNMNFIILILFFCSNSSKNYFNNLKIECNNMMGKIQILKMSNRNIWVEHCNVWQFIYFCSYYQIKFKNLFLRLTILTHRFVGSSKFSKELVFTYF